jgi:hypothetical protein
MDRLNLRIARSRRQPDITVQPGFEITPVERFSAIHQMPFSGNTVRKRHIQSNGCGHFLAMRQNGGQARRTDQFMPRRAVTII